MLHRLLNALILLPDPRCYQVPSDLGLVAHEVAFPNTQGQLLRGLWCAPLGQVGPAPAPQTAAPVVVFCPGTSGNLSSHLYYVELLCRAGCWVLGFDYTGFGHSAGQASLHTLVPDVLGACTFLRREQQVTSFGLFGLSLGANLALQVAAECADVRAVAVEGLALYSEITRGVLEEGIMGPRSITTLAYQHHLPTPRQHHVLNARLVHRWLARLLARAGTALFPFTGKDPRVPARLLHDTPVFCIHGLEDRLLPFEGTIQVYKTLPGRKQLWLIPEVSHAQEAALAVDGEYVAQLAQFFHASLREPGQALLAPLTWTLVPQAPSKYVLRLHNTGPPAAVLLTVVAAQKLVCYTVWIDTEVTIPVLATDEQPWVNALRLLTPERTDTAAEDDLHTRYTPRGARYRTTFQPLIRALSQSLHERHVHEFETLLRRLPQARPEPPFDFFLGLYCVQIMQRTQRTLPHIAQAAARTFVRYWHYGPSQAQPGTTPWDLAAAILGEPVQPQGAVHTGREP